MDYLHPFYITASNGNARNRIRGSRITVWDADTGQNVGSMVVPSLHPRRYLAMHRGRVFREFCGILARATGRRYISPDLAVGVINRRKP